MWDTLCFTVLVHLQLQEKIFRWFRISAEEFPFSSHWFWLNQSSKYNWSRLVLLFSSITFSVFSSCGAEAVLLYRWGIGQRKNASGKLIPRPCFSCIKLNSLKNHTSFRLLSLDLCAKVLIRIQQNEKIPMQDQEGKKG